MSMLSVVSECFHVINLTVHLWLNQHCHRFDVTQILNANIVMGHVASWYTYQGNKIRPEFLVLWEDEDLAPQYTGHRWPGRAAEGVELLCTALIFPDLDLAPAMGSQYGDACSGGGADNGE